MIVTPAADFRRSSTVGDAPGFAAQYCIGSTNDARSEARDSGTPLPDLVAAAHPGTTLPNARAQLGTAPDQARAFATRASSL